MSTDRIAEMEGEEASTPLQRRIRDKLGQWGQALNFKRKSVQDNNNFTSIIETDYLQNSEEDLSQLSKKSRSSGSMCHSESPASSLYYGTFEDHVDEQQCNELTTLLCSKLREKTRDLRIDLFLPSGLLGRIAQDIARMSCCEPCGLRGCVVHIELQRKTSTSRICTVSVDKGTAPTFELHLSLREDGKRWIGLRELLMPFISGCMNETVPEQVFVGAGYQLVKLKLYDHH